jgi:Transposase DDE domain
MTNAKALYQGLLSLLDRGQWQDQRHLKTAVNMIVGLILSSSISLTGWIPYAISRALQAQSVQRRFARWLANDRLDVHILYAPLIQEALTAWGEATLYLALDTTMLWDQYCMIRLSVIYRGRAVPLAWQVVEHRSAQVAFRVYRDLLQQAAKLLPSCTRKVVLLADRGFADVALMQLCQQLGWRYRLRIKSNFLVQRSGHGSALVEQLLPQQKGKAVFLHYVSLTGKCYGPVHLALARPQDEEDPWLIVSDELTGLQTFEEYGLRFAIEENFLDDKSNGFQLEDSKLRSASAIERLFFGIATATLYLVAQGSEVVAQGRRREVDPHWFRGSSYLKIGWQWLKHALNKGWQLMACWRLRGGEDPDPAMASRRQYEASQRKFKQYKHETIAYAT